MKSTVLAIFLCIGVVDQIDNEMASVQVTTSDQSVRELQMSFGLGLKSSVLGGAQTVLCGQSDAQQGASLISTSQFS